MKNVALGDLFTDVQIDRALVIWRTDREHFHARVLSEVVEPAMAQINANTGQENDASYMAYMLEYVFSQAEP